ncbi:gluconate:H+ symporter [Terrimonas alba]|uniref:gluconate:H+ symporter n=1 Tax=Terrimonas alba TaxID=3349636 RepID=UPI0035F3E605
MTLFIVLLALVALVVLIAVFKVNPFLAFLVVCVIAGLCLGIPLTGITKSVETGIGAILADTLIIIVIGAMLGKLIAASGAARQIATTIMKAIGLKNIHWALALIGLIIGIPLFYNTGFVLMIPLIFSIVYQYKLPAVATSISLLAALSVAHGFLPPHPSPATLVGQFKADLGETMLYGIVIAIPAIIVAGPLFSRTLKNIHSKPLETFKPPDLKTEELPGVFNSFFTALLPVILFAVMTLLPMIAGSQDGDVIFFFSRAPIVMLIALIVATFSLGIGRGKSMQAIMDIYSDSVKDIALILLIIAGAGIFKQVLVDSKVANEIAGLLSGSSISPLVLGWLIAALIRVAVGSATVAGITAAGIVEQLVKDTNTSPSLMVLSIGAGSLMFSHVNDAGFWLFKEYFNLSIKDTIRSWSVMETIVSVLGLLGVLLLDIFI